MPKLEGFRRRRLRTPGRGRVHSALGALLTAAAVVSLAVLAGVGPSSVSPAQAQYGTNDNFDSATVITSLPFSDVINTAGTSTEAGEPQFCNFMSETVWYSYTPATDQLLKADTAGTGFATNLNVYQSVGAGIGNLSFIGCAQSGNAVSFSAQAGRTYYLQAGILFGASGDLHVNLSAAPPPSNDDFANAAEVGSLPYSDSTDTSGATIESGEPTPSCGFGSPAGSVWYAFTPSTSGSVSASVSAFFSTEVAAYTGNSLSTLNDLGCRSSGSLLTIHVNAGQTYHFQVGGLFGQRGTLTFNLRETQPPQASFSFSPSDPSIFDTVQFFDQSSDPGQVGIESQAWTFGDGATGTGCCPTHRYALDGDYTVGLSVTTFDGRTGSTTRVVRVETHDVAINKISAPQTGFVGQTREITVGVIDSRYPETVQVQLLRSVPGGFEQVGVLTQSILPRGRSRSTPYTFNYTFSSNDATVGKVTFKAVATIIGARDALPADNEAIASPTRVSH
jgi:hypothetical protein